MRDRTATRFGSCVTPLVLGAIQFCFTQVLPWTFVQDFHPQHIAATQQASAKQTSAPVRPSHKPHGVPPPLARDIVKAATKLPAITSEDALEDTLPALASGFAAAE